MLGQTIGDLLPLALAVAICPIPIIAVILMLFSQRARANSAMFLLGWIVGVLGVTVVVLIIANTQDLTQSNGQPEDSVSTVKLVLGVLLILLAAREWRGRPKEGETADPAEVPRRRSTRSRRPRRSGSACSSRRVNPKSLVLIIAGCPHDLAGRPLRQRHRHRGAGLRRSSPSRRSSLPSCSTT